MNEKEITSMFKAVFQTSHGAKCLEYLENKFVNRPIYLEGKSFEQVAFRQGQCDVVKQIIREVKRNG